MTENDPQTIWKRIKVPNALAAAGWKLIRRDTSAPFALVNESLDLDTGGFPDPTEAISAGRVLMAERAAVADDGGVGAGGAELASGDRPAVLPVNLVDEGWRLHRQHRDIRDGKREMIGHLAQRGRGLNKLQTAIHVDPADAVAEAITLERQRQFEIEARETGTTDLELMAEAGDDVLDQADLGDNVAGVNVNGNGNGHHQDSTPAEIMLALDRIRIDGGTQQRSLFDPAVLEDYAEAMHRQNDADFPAVDVFFDGADYWLADGFYRVAARRQLHLDDIAVHVREGTQRDAVLFSLGANAHHGLPRTPDDKRRAVLVMLRDPEWASWSDAVIADRVRVSLPFVRKLRRQVEAETNAATSAGTDASDAPGVENAPATPQPTRRRGRDGRIQETARIGKRDTAGELTEAAQLTLDDPTLPDSGTSNEVEKSATVPPLETPTPTTPPSDDPPASEPGEAPRRCSRCAKTLSNGDFQNVAGECWDCAGKGISTVLGAHRTFADLGTPHKLKVSLYFVPAHGRNVYVSITGGGLTTDHNLDVTDIELPAPIFDLVKRHLGRARRAMNAVMRAAPAKAQRKPAAVAKLKRVPTTKKSSTKKIAKAPGKTRELKPAKRGAVGPTKTRRPPSKKK
jgi:hypothetical protein